MVRLLREILHGGECDGCKFQSHNGAIAALVVVPPYVNYAEVSIPQWCDCCSSRLISTFLRYWFQSHNGAIAASQGVVRCVSKSAVSIPQWCDCCRKQASQIAQRFAFQSHNGAIAAGILPSNEASIDAVSIPQWCDCCETTHLPQSGLTLSFNPTMVRLLPNPKKPPSTPTFRFQSHNGAIAATWVALKVNANIAFQSHNGAIAA